MLEKRTHRTTLFKKKKKKDNTEVFCCQERRPVCLIVRLISSGSDWTTSALNSLMKAFTGASLSHEMTQQQLRPVEMDKRIMASLRSLLRKNSDTNHCAVKSSSGPQSKVYNFQQCFTAASFSIRETMLPLKWDVVTFH